MDELHITIHFNADQVAHALGMSVISLETWLIWNKDRLAGMYAANLVEDIKYFDSVDEEEGDDDE